MSISFFLTGDIHFDYFRQFSKLYEDGTTSRLNNIKRVLEEGFKKSSTDFILFLGDILNRSKSVDPILANYVNTYFKSLKGNRVIVFDGNHDCRKTFGQKNSMLKPILPDNIEYIESPVSILVSGNYLFHILPFYPDIEVIKTSLEEFKPNYDKVNILLSHFSVGDAKITDDFSVSYRMESINLGVLKKFDYCFLGDIHLSQQLKDLVFYPGSPVQHNFSEEGQEKKTWKITIDNQEIRKEAILSNAPSFKTIMVEREGDIGNIIKEKGNFVKVVSKIPLIHKVNLDEIVYLEEKEEVTQVENIPFVERIKRYVLEREPELLSLLFKTLESSSRLQS